MIFRDFLFRQKLPVMDRGLDAYALREQTIARNIANVNTPGYKPQEVKFEELFADERHAYRNPEEGLPEPQVTEAPVNEDQRLSGESYVNIDKEMSELAQNQIRFRFASRMVRRYFQGLGSAITGFRE